MDTTVNNYPERFLTYLEVEKNCSQHTIESYQKDLAAFAEFMLRRNKQNFFWQQTGPLDVRGYLAELNEKQYARRTKLKSTNCWRCPIKVRYWVFATRRCWRCFMLPVAVYPSW